MTDAWGGPKEPSGWGDVDKSGDKGGWGSGGDADKADGGKADDGWAKGWSAEGEEGGKGATGEGEGWGRETEWNDTSTPNETGVSARTAEKEDDGWGKGWGDTATGAAGGAATEAAGNASEAAGNDEGGWGSDQAWGQSTGADAATTEARGSWDSPVAGWGKDDASTDKQKGKDNNASALAAKGSGWGSPVGNVAKDNDGWADSDKWPVPAALTNGSRSSAGDWERENDNSADKSLADAWTGGSNGWSVPAVLTDGPRSSTGGWGRAPDEAANEDKYPRTGGVERMEPRVNERSRRRDERPWGQQSNEESRAARESGTGWDAGWDIAVAGSTDGANGSGKGWGTSSANEKKSERNHGASDWPTADWGANPAIVAEAGSSWGQETNGEDKGEKDGRSGWEVGQGKEGAREVENERQMETGGTGWGRKEVEEGTGSRGKEGEATGGDAANDGWGEPAWGSSVPEVGESGGEWGKPGGGTDLGEDETGSKGKKGEASGGDATTDGWGEEAWGSSVPEEGGSGGEWGKVGGGTSSGGKEHEKLGWGGNDREGTDGGPSADDAWNVDDKAWGPPVVEGGSSGGGWGKSGEAEEGGWGMGEKQGRAEVPEGAIPPPKPLPKPKTAEEEAAEAVKREEAKLRGEKRERAVRRVDTFRKKAQELLHGGRYERGAELDEKDFQGMLELLDSHPKAEGKKGCGVKAIKMDETVREDGESVCFFVIRTDGSVEDFSYRKCLYAMLDEEDPSEKLKNQLIAWFYRPRPPRQTAVPPATAVTAPEEAGAADGPDETAGGKADPAGDRGASQWGEGSASWNQEEAGWGGAARENKSAPATGWGSGGDGGWGTDTPVNEGAREEASSEKSGWGNWGGRGEGEGEAEGTPWGAGAAGWGAGDGTGWEEETAKERGENERSAWEKAEGGWGEGEPDVRQLDKEGPALSFAKEKPCRGQSMGAEMEGGAEGELHGGNTSAEEAAWLMKNQGTIGATESSQPAGKGEWGTPLRGSADPSDASKTSPAEIGRGRGRALTLPAWMTSQVRDGHLGVPHAQVPEGSHGSAIGSLPHIGFNPALAADQEEILPPPPPLVDTRPSPTVLEAGVASVLRPLPSDTAAVIPPLPIAGADLVLPPRPPLTTDAIHPLRLPRNSLALDPNEALPPPPSVPLPLGMIAGAEVPAWFSDDVILPPPPPPPATKGQHSSRSQTKARVVIVLSDDEEDTPPKSGGAREKTSGQQKGDFGGGEGLSNTVVKLEK
eukprot:TRINITY_DN19402_c0_g1_i2.p1 TRINITY_DN19402_c0_g1~~TRINITY_DN19402_c0_g1_i2.p1  ORF type:complete len:1241 (-),score=314.25 TRINITY_DN19402_c0_g1_i2:630-4352(-)